MSNAAAVPLLPGWPGWSHQPCDRRNQKLLRWAVTLSLLGHATALLFLPGLTRPARPLMPLQATLRLPASGPSSALSGQIEQRAAEHPEQQPRPAASKEPVAERHPPEVRRPQQQRDTATMRAASGAAVPTTVSAPATPAPASTQVNVAANVVAGISPPAPAATKAAVEAHDLSSQDALAGYGRKLAELLARQQKYPRLATLRGWEGEVRLQVRVARKGNIVAIQLAHTSGFEVLDQQAMQLLQASALPPLPDSVHEAEVQLIVPIHFKLNKPS